MAIGGASNSPARSAIMGARPWGSLPAPPIAPPILHLYQQLNSTADPPPLLPSASPKAQSTAAAMAALALPASVQAALEKAQAAMYKAAPHLRVSGRSPARCSGAPPQPLARCGCQGRAHGAMGPAACPP